VRIALSNSFNIPAVKTLEFVGIYDNPNTPEKEGMIAMAQRLGITSFTRTTMASHSHWAAGDVT